MLLGDYEAAMDSFKDALKLGESNEEAMYGLVHCQIMLHQFADAEQQVEFLKVIHENNQNAKLLFLEALLTSADPTKQSKLLQKAVSVHMEQLREHVQVGHFLLIR